MYSDKFLYNVLPKLSFLQSHLIAVCNIQRAKGIDHVLCHGFRLRLLVYYSLVWMAHRPDPLRRDCLELNSDKLVRFFSLHLLFHFGDLLLVGNRIVEELNRETTRIWIIPQNL